MEKEISFVKLAGKWFAHFPDYPKSPDDLEMVMGADVMCEMVDVNNTGFITIHVSDEPFEDLITTREYVLDFVDTTGDEGAYYKLRNFDLEVWLCNVTKYALGYFPQNIYIGLV